MTVVESNDDWIYGQEPKPEHRPQYRPGQAVTVKHNGLRVLEPPVAANGYTLKAVTGQGMPLVFQVGPGMWEIEPEDPIGWPPRKDDEWVASETTYSILSYPLPNSSRCVFYAIPATLGRGYNLEDARDLAAFCSLYPILVRRNG